MNEPNAQTPRRSGPHAPLPEAIVAAPAPDPSAAEIKRSATPPPESSLARAARRAAEIEEHNQGIGDESDQFYINPSIIPEGFSYEWRRFTLLGMQDPGYQVRLAQDGWESVPRARHPELMPLGHTGETIERHGMILMERPLTTTEKAKARAYAKAREQVRGKEEQLGMAPSGHFGRDNKGSGLAKINRTFEAIPVPKE